MRKNSIERPRTFTEGPQTTYLPPVTRFLFIVLAWVGTAGCFGRLQVPTAEELEPTLLKAFTYAQHGRMLSPDDARTLREKLTGAKLDLFERLMDNLEDPCALDDRACGAGKIDELAALYRAWADEVPDAFEVQLTAASGLFFIGQSALRAGFERGDALVDDGRARVSDLLRRYPEEPMVHGQLAFMKTFEQGNEEEIRAHIARCLELDPSTDWCRKLARKY